MTASFCTTIVFACVQLVFDVTTQLEAYLAGPGRATALGSMSPLSENTLGTTDGKLTLGRLNEGPLIDGAASATSSVAFLTFSAAPWNTCRGALQTQLFPVLDDSPQTELCYNSRTEDRHAIAQGYGVSIPQTPHLLCFNLLEDDLGIS